MEGNIRTTWSCLLLLLCCAVLVAFCVLAWCWSACRAELTTLLGPRACWPCSSRLAVLLTSVLLLLISIYPLCYPCVSCVCLSSLLASICWTAYRVLHQLIWLPPYLHVDFSCGDVGTQADSTTHSVRLSERLGGVHWHRPQEHDGGPPCLHSHPIRQRRLGPDGGVSARVSREMG